MTVMARGGGGGGGGSSGSAVDPNAEIPDDHVMFVEPTWPPPGSSESHNLLNEAFLFVSELIIMLIALYTITHLYGKY